MSLATSGGLKGCLSVCTKTGQNCQGKKVTLNHRYQEDILHDEPLVCVCVYTDVRQLIREGRIHIASSNPGLLEAF